MRLILTTLIVGLAIVSTGCGQKQNTAQQEQADATLPLENADVSAPTAAPLASADFANAVAGNGKFEVDSAALAPTAASSAEIKSLAAMISTDHKKAGEDLKTAARASSPSFSPMVSLNSKQKADLAALKGVSGAEFDRLYRTQQIAAHTETLSVLRAYAAGGSSPQLKDFATKVLPTVQVHLDQLNSLASS